jgi:hypothetical protein
MDVISNKLVEYFLDLQRDMHFKIEIAKSVLSLDNLKVHDFIKLT